MVQDGAPAQWRPVTTAPAFIFTTFIEVIMTFAITFLAGYTRFVPKFLELQPTGCLIREVIFEFE